MSRPPGKPDPATVPRHVSPLCPDQNPLQLRHISFEREWHRRFNGQKFLDVPGSPVIAPRFAEGCEGR